MSADRNRIGFHARENSFNAGGPTVDLAELNRSNSNAGTKTNTGNNRELMEIIELPDEIDCVTGTEILNNEMFIINYCEAMLYKVDLNTYETSSYGSLHGNPLGIAWDGMYLWIGDHTGTYRGYSLEGEGLTEVGSFVGPVYDYTAISWDGSAFLVRSIWDNFGDIYRLDYDGSILGQYSPNDGFENYTTSGLHSHNNSLYTF